MVNIYTTKKNTKLKMPGDPNTARNITLVHKNEFRFMKQILRVFFCSIALVAE